MPVLKVIKFALVCIFFLSTFTNTVKANSPVMTTEHWVIKHFTKFIRYGRSRQHSPGLIHMDGIKAKFLAEFDQVDHGFDGITQEELESFSKLKKNYIYSKTLLEFHQRDINQDQILTKKELEKSYLIKASSPLHIEGVYLNKTKNQIAFLIKKLVQKDLIMDSNEDQKITFAEAIKYAKAKNLKHLKAGRHIGDKTNIPLSFDIDNNGRIERKEFQRELERLLATIDKNGDGIFSNEERENYQQRFQDALKIELKLKRKLKKDRKKALNNHNPLLRNLKENCKAPEFPKNAKIIFISGNYGKSLTNTLFEEKRGAVSLIDITINKTKHPLFIVASSKQKNIWRFKGDVKAIAGIWLSQGNKFAAQSPRLGVIGLPKERVHFTNSQGCIPIFTSIKPSNLKAVKKYIKTLIGKEPQAIVVQGRMHPIILPQATKVLAPNKSDPGLLFQKNIDSHILTEIAKDFNNRNLVSIRAKDVLTPLKTKIAAGLPTNLALAKLVDEGVLKVIETIKISHYSSNKNLGEVRMVGKTKFRPSKWDMLREYKKPKRFLIKKKTTLKSEYFKEFYFTLDAGVPLPTLIKGGAVSLFSKDENKIITLKPKTKIPQKLKN
ncbi:MAG: hypothetical protein ABJN57_03920 [Hyphomicrobiales bacterium]